MERDGRRTKGYGGDSDGEGRPADAEEEGYGVPYPDGASGSLLSRGAEGGRGLYLRVGVADDVKAYSHGFIEEMLGRPQGNFLPFCVVAVLIGFTTVLVLLLARAADLCSPAPKKADQWTVGRSRWCCQLFNVACPAPEPLERFEEMIASAFNCTPEDYGWSELQKAYCCQTAGMCDSGADPTATRPPPYDCTISWSNWAAEWPASKQAWCCQNANRGCVVPEPTPRAKRRYCDPAEDRELWSEVKKEWCCWYSEVGCPSLEVETPADMISQVPPQVHSA